MKPGQWKQDKGRFVSMDEHAQFGLIDNHAFALWVQRHER